MNAIDYVLVLLVSECLIGHQEHPDIVIFLVCQFYSQVAQQSDEGFYGDHLLVGGVAAPEELLEGEALLGEEGGEPPEHTLD